MFNKEPKVLVVIVRAGPKTYAYDFFPRFAELLDYPNKEILLVNEKNCPELKDIQVGENIAATGRDFGIHYARKHNFDYLYFQDLDLEPDPNLLSSLVETGYPLVGSLVAARGDPYKIIGHNYASRDHLSRMPLYFPDLKEGQEVDGIGSCSLLIHKTIFDRVDHTGYIGPAAIPDRFTADDEYLLIQIYNKIKIRPRIILIPRSWHYSDDGYKYRILGEKKRWKN